GSGSRNKGSGAVTLLRGASELEMARPRTSWRFRPDGLPKRAKQCPDNLVNLSAHYNAGLSFFCAPIEPGVQSPRGVQFDLRGIVQLSCAHQDMAWDFPAKVEGIRVGCRCQRLHFLQAASWEDERGTAIGEYVIHFADGQVELVPLIYGENSISWWC